MFRLIITSSLTPCRRSICSKTINPRLFRASLPCLLPDSLKEKHPQSPTVSYLRNSCGLSLEKAKSVSKKLVKSLSPDKADSVLELLRCHGFTTSHITCLVSKHPSFLLISGEILEPKMEFFRSLGLQGSHLLRIFMFDVFIMRSSLNNRIIPTCNFLKTVVGSNEGVLAVMKRYPSIFRTSVEEILLPNVSTLRAHGVPESLIGNIIKYDPKCLMARSEKFRQVVNEVKEMGFDPRRSMFSLAFRSFVIMSRSNWVKKKKLLMTSFGWSEDEFESAFKMQPLIIHCSEKKIAGLTNFYLKELSLDPSYVARCPNILLISLVRRVIPRCAVLKVLVSKGLIKEKVKSSSMLIMRKEEFEKRYVTRFLNYSEVINAYRGEIGFEVLNDGR